MNLGNYTQLVWSFRDQAAGWTERWVANGLLSQVTASQIMNNYLQFRMALCGVGIWADFFRASYLDGSGTSYKFYPNQFTTTTGAPPTNYNGTPIGAGAIAYAPLDPTPPDRPYSTLMFTFAAATGQQKKLFMSGIPDDVIIDPFGPTFTALYNQGISLYRKQSIISNNLGFLTRRGAGSQVKTPIVAVTAGVPGSVNAPGSVVVAGATVQIGGFRGLRGYRWKGIVLSNVAGVVTVAGYNPPANLSGGNGYLQQVGFTWVAVATGDLGRETHRNRGKGSLVPVGRRKARRN